MSDLLLDPILSFGGSDPATSLGWSDQCAGSFPHKHEAAFGDDSDWERTASLSDSDEAMASDRPRASLSGSERATRRDERRDAPDLKIDPRTDFSDLGAFATRWRHGGWHGGGSSRSVPVSGGDEDPPGEPNGFGPLRIAMRTASIFRDVVFDEYGIILDEKPSDKRPSRIGEVLECGPTEIETMEERADRAVETVVASASASSATGHRPPPGPGSSCFYGLQPLIAGGDCGDVRELYDRWPGLCPDTYTAHRALSEFYRRRDCGRDPTKRPVGGSPPGHHHG